MFKRSSQSTAIQIALTLANAENILTALAGEGPLPELGCIEDMRVTLPEIDDTAENAAVLVAFSALALACKGTKVCGMLLPKPELQMLQLLPQAESGSQKHQIACIKAPRRTCMVHRTETLLTVQVAVLTCHEDIALPPFMALRHLIVSTSGSAALPITTLKNAVQSETLSLGIFGSFQDWSQTDIDVSSLHALKHMTIENLAPQDLHLPDGCLLHVVWNEERIDGSMFRGWAQVRSLWQAQRNRLGSLQITFLDSEFQKLNTAVLQYILTDDQELPYLSLWIPRLGSNQKPFSVSASRCQMLALAERVRLSSEYICSISVVGMQPKWKTSSIDAAKVNLEVEDTAVLVRSLESFWIEGVMTHGFPSLSMMHELHQSDRKYSINRQSGVIAEGTPLGFSFGTLLDCAALSRFQHLMCCGCSSCLACLSRGGKLARDSQWPECYWSLPVYKI